MIDNFLIGAGSVMDLFGNYYEYDLPENNYELDCEAIRSDFKAVFDNMTNIFPRTDYL